MQFKRRNGEALGVGVSAWSVTVRRMHSDEGISRLVAAVRELDPKPRERRWVSVSFCVLDAVYSIGAHYDNHVVPVVRRVAADFDVESPSVEMSVPEAADPVPLDAFLDCYTSVEALVETTKNRQNTSTRGGIRKADAVLRYAEVLREHGLLTLDDARRLLTDTVRLDAAESALRKVPGEGGAGVRRGYLWMLIGHQDTVKPDRMVLRWLARHGAETTPDSARLLLRDIAQVLSEETGRVITAWEVDHAIWQAARTSSTATELSSQEPESGRT